jgi:hypothetical protein
MSCPEHGKGLYRAPKHGYESAGGCKGPIDVSNHAIVDLTSLSLMVVPMGLPHDLSLFESLIPPLLMPCSPWGRNKEGQ